MLVCCLCSNSVGGTKITLNGKDKKTDCATDSTQSELKRNRKICECCM